MQLQEAFEFDEGEAVKVQPVAVLCCAPNSFYHALPGVECFNEARDVFSFSGGVPVVAHPVCAPWSAFCAHQWKPVPKVKEIGPLCIEWLQKCGGVLEHPAHSRLFDVYDLPKPDERKGNLWTIEVSQAWWGYSMLKKTWLVFCGIEPELVLPTIPYKEHNSRNGEGDRRRQQKMSKNQRAATVPTMARWLVETARKATTPHLPISPSHCLTVSRLPVPD